MPAECVVNALFDTNILIDYLKGVFSAQAERDLYRDKAISIITWMEVQVGTSPSDQTQVDQFLRRFTLLPIDSAVAASAATLPRSNKIKLPDAIIWATAQTEGRLLVARNSKNFLAFHPDVRAPYVI